MSIGSAIQSLFGGAATTPQSVQPPLPGVNPGMAPTGNPNPGQGLQGTYSSPQTAPNGMIPTANPGQQPAPGQENVQQAESSPFDAFKDIWQTPSNPDEANKPIFSGMDPKKIMESARQVDFSKAITPEILQAATAGGQQGVEALVKAMNSVAQTVYAQSAVATTKIVEQALSKQTEQFDARMPSMVKKFSANESILANNPMFSNPALQPLVGALQEQLIRKNPNATSSEIQQQVAAYFSAVGSSFAPKQKESAASASVRQNQDWSAFLE